MTSSDEITLMAYIDGELSEPERAAFEERLGKEPELAILLDELQMNEALIKAAFNETLRNDVPIAEVVPLRRESERKRGSKLSYVVTALAASVVTVVVGSLFGYLMINDIVQAQFARVEQQKVIDRAQRDSALAQVLENEVSGVKVSWRNPDSGNWGGTMPTSTYKSASGQYCREFEESVITGGVETLEAGVACRQANGQWKVRIRYYPG